MTLDFQRVLDSLYDGVYVVDRERRITYWNEAARRISGYSRDEVVGSRCSDEILEHVDLDGESLCQGGCPLSVAMTENAAQEAVAFLHHRSGHRVAVAVRATPLHDETGAVIGGVEVFSAGSTDGLYQARIQDLETLAMLDDLTRIPNRRYLNVEMERRLSEMKRYGWPFGVLFLDIDRFKLVNDTHGHVVGDQMLKAVASTFVASARSFDLFGRWGGEEFVGIMTNVDAEGLQKTGDRIRTLVAQSFLTVAGQRVSVTVSAGGTLARANDSVTSLIERADRLMFVSKRAGRDRVTVDLLRAEQGAAGT